MALRVGPAPTERDGRAGRSGRVDHLFGSVPLTAAPMATWVGAPQGEKPAINQCEMSIQVAVGEAAILLPPPPLYTLVGVPIGMERERQRNDSLVNGYIQGYDNATIAYCQANGIVYESYGAMVSALLLGLNVLRSARVEQPFSMAIHCTTRLATACPSLAFAAFPPV